jgi:hypothetical protein
VGSQDTPLGTIDFLVDQQDKTPLLIVLGGQLFLGDHFQFVVDAGFGLKETWWLTVSPHFASRS